MIDDNSKRALEVIAIFRLLPQLNSEERLALLESSSYRGVIKRIITLLFNHRFSKLENFSPPIAKRIKNADSRLIQFIRLHEELKDKNLNFSSWQNQLYKLFTHKMHIKEVEFYSKLMNNNLFCLDYYYIRESLFDGDDFIPVPAKFCKAYMFQKHWKISYPTLVQPCIDGLQLKVIVKSGKVKVWTRAQENITKHTRFLAKVVKDYADKHGFNHFEVDGMAYSKDYSLWSMLSLKARSSFNALNFYLYDAIVMDRQEHLSRRLKRVKFIAAKVGKKYENIKAMPTYFVNSEAKLISLMKKFPRNPEKGVELQKGVIAKDPESIYVPERTESWVKVRDPLSPACCKLKQINWSLSENNHLSVKDIIGIDNNGREVSVQFSRLNVSWLLVNSQNFYGRTFEFTWENNKPTFYRFIPGRSYF